MVQLGVVKPRFNIVTSSGEKVQRCSIVKSAPAQKQPRWPSVNKIWRLKDKSNDPVRIHGPHQSEKQRIMATSLTKRTLKDLPSKVTEGGLNFRKELMSDLVKVVKENDDPEVPTDAIVKGVAKVWFLVSHISCHTCMYLYVSHVLTKLIQIMV